MNLARRMLAAGLLGRRQAVSVQMQIEACESGWNGVSGLIYGLTSTPTSPGSGYAVNDIFDVLGGVGGKGIVLAVGGTGNVTSVQVYASGSGYSAGAGKATSGGSGSGLTVQTSTTSSSVVHSTTHSEGTNSVRISTSTTKIRACLAYKAISPGDLSAYSRLAFRLRTSDPIADSERFRVCLCSDAGGLEVVDEFIVPATAQEDVFVEHILERTGSGPLMSDCASIAVWGGATPIGTGFAYFDDFRVLT